MIAEKENSSEQHPVVLVTGGSGFLGERIVEELLDPASPLKVSEVRVFDIQTYTGKHRDEVTFISGDITNYEQVKQACSGVDLVMHAAAIIDWGVKDDSEVFAINVGGTENVIRACRENNVGSLVYTSSLDAVYTGKPLRDIDESLSYPDKHKTSYCRSKRLGEELIMDANNDVLKTTVLRPSGIFGEADPYHIGPLIDMAKSGFYIRLGNGTSKCQHVYVGNMAYVHVLAGLALLENNEAVMGQPYFITDGAGSNFFTFFDKIITDAGFVIRPKNLWLPKWVARPMASITEFGAWLIRPLFHAEVKFSRFAVDYTCNDFTFTSEKAAADFGFKPKYSAEEAMRRTSEYYKKQVEKE